MGIQGLLPALKSIAVQTHVKHYAQQTLGVDAYVWLHRGAISCAWNLALGNPTTKYVDYAMHRVKMLQHYGVTPYIVFDGDFLPSKQKTEVERAAKRAENLKAGRECMARGDTRQAQEFFQKSIDITPDMALRFIRALQANQVDYVVAPYEADAQLAYLERIGLIDGIVTEDSDLLVFGAKKVLFKLNEFGECTEISRSRFAHNSNLALSGWDDNMFRYMAILSGCDYLNSVPGMGLKSAHRLVKRYKTLERILRGLRAETGLRMPVDYEDNFRRADRTFIHQYVFCPLKKSLIMGQQPEIELDEETTRLIGKHLSDDLARSVADGSIDPITKKVILLSESAGLRKYASKYSNVAPAGNMLIDKFVQGEKVKKDRVLCEKSINEQLPQVGSETDAMAKRLAPRPSLREQAQAKKLKLLDSTPSPPRDRIPESPLKSSDADKENRKISPFFARRTPMKCVKEDADLAKAIAASVEEEERRKSFAGFENPVAFEVMSETAKCSPQTGLISSYFVPASPPLPSPRHEANQPLPLLQRQDTECDSPEIAHSALPTPPNSQNFETVVTQWREKYACRQPLSIPSTPHRTHAPKEGVATTLRPSTSISRMGGHALSRRASSPGMQGSIQRRPFLPHSSSLSQSDASHRTRL